MSAPRYSSFPYAVKVKIDSLAEVWLKNNISQANEEWMYDYDLTPGISYYFKNQADATMFALRWL